MPTPSISGITSFCAGSSTLLNAGAYAGYTWSTGETSQTISVNNAGAFTVTVTNGNGCSGSTSVTTTVNPLPTPAISGTTLFCAGSSTILYAGYYAGYTWSTGETSQSISVNTAGTFMVTVTDGNGCSASTSIATTVNANPTPSVSGTTSFCAGRSTLLDAGAYSSYNWSTGETLQSISVNTAGTFMVTVTDANGCSGSNDITTTFNSTPTPSINGTLIFCAGSSTTLDAGAGYSNYSWSTGATTQTVSVNTAETFTVTVTNAIGCSGFASVTTIINNSIAPIITGNTPICGGGSVTLSAPVMGIVNQRYATSVINFSSQYEILDWSANQVIGPPDLYPTYGDFENAWASLTQDDTREYLELGYLSPAPISFINIYETYFPGAVDTVYIKNPNTGLFEIVYTASAAAAPEVARILHITFPQTSFNVSEIRIAINSPAVPDWNEIDAVAIGKEDSYLWSTGATTQTVSVSTAGAFTVTVSDAYGCSGSASVTTTINPLPTPSISGTTLFCAGSATTLDAGAGYSNYSWSTGATTQNVSVNTTSTFTVTVTNANGCSGSISATTMLKTIDAKISVAEQITCNGLCDGSLRITNFVGTAPASYVWSTGATTKRVNNLCAATYTATVTDAGGCSLTLQRKLTQPGLLKPNGAKTEITTINDGQMHFSPGGGTAPYSYLWSDGFTASSRTGITPGSYTITISDFNGCSKTITTQWKPVVLRTALSVSDFETGMYPNPATTFATLQFDAIADGKGVLIVYDLLGQQMINKPIDVKAGDNQFVLDLNAFTKGVYNVRVAFNGMVRNQWLVVQ